jgi:putative ABC transport system substrate-binding protein
MTQQAEKMTHEIPIISTLGLTDKEFTSGRSTGVCLTHSFKSQIEWLKKFFPEQQHIAVFYNPQENAKTIQQLQKVTEQAGLSMLSIPVQSPKQLPVALEQLSHNIEVLLTIPDELVLAPSTIKEVMLASFRNRVPLVGLSENWVKSGALYALSWDYDDLGRQCAEQTQKLLKGQSVASILPEKPRKVSYAINLKIAEHLDIALAETLIRNAKKTFH